jgi:hypothetical protein
MSKKKPVQIPKVHVSTILNEGHKQAVAEKEILGKLRARADRLKKVKAKAGIR